LGEGRGRGGAAGMGVAKVEDMKEGRKLRIEEGRG
jgi:hypothetical protein